MNTSDQNYENGANQVGNFLAGFLLGGLSGAVTMLLLAPQSGKKTRTNLQRKGIEVRDQMVKSVEDATAQVRSKAREVTHDVQEQAEDVQEQAEDLQQRGQDVIDEQRDHLGQSLKDLGKAVHT